MAYCTINGIPLPVSNNESNKEPILIEDAQRMEDGSLFVDRRAEKTRWKVKLAPQTPTYAGAWRKLIHGDGHYWSFDSHLYSSKGLGPSGSTGAYSQPSTAYLGSSGVFQEAGSDLSFTALPSATSPWTVGLVRKVGGGAWIHYFINSASQKWVDGVRNDAASTTFASMSSGVLTVAADAVSNTLLDELVIYPFALPTDWPPYLYAFQNTGAGGVQIGSLRQLKLGGTIVSDGTTRTVIGRVTAEDDMRSKVSGVNTPLSKLTVELEEV